MRLRSSPFKSTTPKWGSFAKASGKGTVASGSRNHVLSDFGGHRWSRRGCSTKAVRGQGVGKTLAKFQKFGGVQADPSARLYYFCRSWHQERAGVLVSLANAAFSRTPSSLQSLRHLSSHQLPLQARRLEGKVAIITGGGSGIGEAAAKLFVSHGAHVIIADIQQELGSDVASSLAPHAHFFHCNVTEEGHVGALVDFALSLHGHLDIMYNNAGTGRAEPSPHELDMEGFRAVMDVNIKGAVLGMKHASRAMISKNRGGSILCTASMVGTMPILGLLSYTISKHAVVGLVKSSAAELGKYGIRVNCVSPTVAKTPLAMDVFKRAAPGIDLDVVAEEFVELKLAGDRGGLKAGDVANAALFLSSDEARYISGHNLVIDGAFSASKTPNFGVGRG